MTTTLDTLRLARALLSEPERWTQGSEARDEANETCGAWNSRAVCWCATGAISRSADAEAYLPAVQALVWQGLSLLATPRESIDDEIIAWNDEEARTHAEVLAAFDRAIERLEREQAP